LIGVLHLLRAPTVWSGCVTRRQFMPGERSNARSVGRQFLRADENDAHAVYGINPRGATARRVRRGARRARINLIARGDFPLADRTTRNWCKIIVEFADPGTTEEDVPHWHSALHFSQ